MVLTELGLLYALFNMFLRNDMRLVQRYQTWPSVCLLIITIAITQQIN